jgi:hypothetical protein
MDLGLMRIGVMWEKGEDDRKMDCDMENEIEDEVREMRESDWLSIGIIWITSGNCSKLFDRY